MDRDKLIVALKTEALDFAGLCRAAVRFAVKKVRKEDVSAERAEMSDLQRKSRRFQLAAGIVLAAMIILLRGCGGVDGRSAASATSPKKNISAVDKMETAEALLGRLVNTPLYHLAVVTEAPAEGSVWENYASVIKILQVVDGGVLAETPRSQISDTFPVKTFFVRTSRNYADGDMLAAGFYRANGRVTYTAVSGARRTVYAFDELPEFLQKEMMELREHGKIRTNKAEESVQ